MSDEELLAELATIDDHIKRLMARLLQQGGPGPAARLAVLGLMRECNAALGVVAAGGMYDQMHTPRRKAGE